MKKIFTLCIALLISVFFSNIVFAQYPTFNCTAKNFIYTDSIGTGGVSYDALTFDIYIEHTNVGVSGPFEYALGQYYFNVNTAFGDSTNYRYYIVPGSTEFSNPIAIPRNPSIKNPDVTSTTGASLRVNSNTVLGAGSGPIVSSTYPGTRVCTFRLKKKVGSFESGIYPNFFQSGTGTYGSNDGSAWRLALANPFTKIFAYVGTTNTDISLQGTYTVDYSPIFLPNVPTTYLYSPSNNSVNSPLTVNFVWGKNSQAVKYLFQLASDS